MISPIACNGFDYLLKQALKGALAPNQEDTFSLDVVEDISVATDKKIVILTTASYLFRVIAMIYFTPDAHSRHFMALMNNLSPSNMTDTVYYDVMAERGNIFCGILNRELAKYFPHMGMSTPNFMERQCAIYIEKLEAGHVRHVKVTINSDWSFYASLCVCDHADLDFAVDVVVEEESNTGELEMF